MLAGQWEQGGGAQTGQDAPDSREKGVETAGPQGTRNSLKARQGRTFLGPRWLRTLGLALHQVQVLETLSQCHWEESKNTVRTILYKLDFPRISIKCLGILGSWDARSLVEKVCPHVSLLCCSGPSHGCGAIFLPSGALGGEQT